MKLTEEDKKVKFDILIYASEEVKSLMRDYGYIFDKIDIPINFIGINKDDLKKKGFCILGTNYLVGDVHFNTYEELKQFLEEGIGTTEWRDLFERFRNETKLNKIDYAFMDEAGGGTVILDSSKESNFCRSIFISGKIEGYRLAKEKFNKLK